MKKTLCFILAALPGALLLTLSLTSCGSKHPPVQAAATPPVATTAGRFVLTLQQSYSDPEAYGKERHVYTLTDSQTGQVWVGVSGIGISELGSHQSGKVTVEDER